MHAYPPPGFDELSLDEQIEYVQSLWERICERSQAELPVPGWHREVVERRLEEHRQSPHEAQSWTDVRERLQGKLRASG